MILVDPINVLLSSFWYTTTSMVHNKVCIHTFVVGLEKSEFSICGEEDCLSTIFHYDCTKGTRG